MPLLACGRNSHVAFSFRGPKKGGGNRLVLLHRYMAREVGGVLIVAAPTILILIGLLQGMRLAPLMAGAALGGLELAELVGLLLIPLATISLPAASVIALLMALGRLAGDGELLALRASGAGTGRIGAAPLTICAAVALATGANALVLEPMAYAGLERRMAGLMTRSALGQIRPTVISEPSPGLSVLVRQRQGDRLGGVFIEDRRGDRPIQLFAVSANLSPRQGRTEVRLVLSEGQLQAHAPDGTLTRASFERLEATFRLDEAARELAAVLPRRMGRSSAALAVDAIGSDHEVAREAALLLHRRLAMGPTTLGLCLLTLLLGLWRPITGRPVVLVLAALLILGSHLLVRVGEAAVGSGVLPPVAGGWLAAAATWAAAFVGVVFPSVRKLLARL
jgi:lipopolysaccharide export LptBFGC system permease protein LptF